METTSPVRKPSSVMAWIGFGISLAVLLLVWLVDVLVISAMNTDVTDTALSLFMILFLVGVPIGLFGLIFSIVGLVQAIKNYTPRWIGACGIIFCCLSIVSFFVPLVVATVQRTQTEESRESKTIGPDGQKYVDHNDIVMEITSMGRIKCYDNRNGKDKNPAVIRTYSSGIKREISTWLKINDIDCDSVTVHIEYERGSDYSDVVDLIDVLNSIGVKHTVQP